MTRNTAVTVRLPGASSAPTTNTWTCSHTRLENTGANFTISRVRATGTVSMPHLFWHKSEGQLTNLSLCFQSPLQMDKVELSERRDIAAAKQCLLQAIEKRGVPQKITLDGYAASYEAVGELQKEGVLPADLPVSPSKYLNNLIEQEHRYVKQRVRPMLGFKRF